MAGTAKQQCSNKLEGTSNHTPFTRNSGNLQQRVLNLASYLSFCRDFSQSWRCLDRGGRLTTGFSCFSDVTAVDEGFIQVSIGLMNGVESDLGILTHIQLEHSLSFSYRRADNKCALILGETLTFLQNDFRIRIFFDTFAPYQESRMLMTRDTPVVDIRGLAT